MQIEEERRRKSTTTPALYIIGLSHAAFRAAKAIIYEV
jgi:hypothetical protein